MLKICRNKRLVEIRKYTRVFFFFFFYQVFILCVDYKSLTATG